MGKKRDRLKGKMKRKKEIKKKSVEMEKRERERERERGFRVIIRKEVSKTFKKAKIKKCVELDGLVVEVFF